MAPAGGRLRPAAALALLACLALGSAPLTARAAVKIPDEPSAAAQTFDANTDEAGGSLMTPIRGELLGRTFYFEIPHNPVGVLFMAHGCVHDAADFWPASKACPECSGLPEEVAHTKQAMARGYAVLAVDSSNRDPMNRCYSYPVDKWGVKYIIENWTRQYNLQALPVFGLGISAGASFVLRLPKITRVNGIVSEVLGATYETFPVENLGGTYPPTIFIDMMRDRTMSQRITQSMLKLREWNVSTARIAIDPRPVPHSFFSDRSEFIPFGLSRMIVNGLHRIGMLDAQGYVTQDPRYTTKPWRDELAATLGQAVLGPEDGSIIGPASDWALISEQMNVAFANHEIIGDHLTASLAWLESGGTTPIGELEHALWAARETAKLQPAREAAPEFQDDEALKQAAAQVEQQLATTAGKKDNWGDLYAAYVEWLATNPVGDITFPAWRASPAAGRFGYKDAAQAAEDSVVAQAAAAVASGQPERGDLGVLPQHSAL